MEFCMNEVSIMTRGDLPAHIRACAAHGIYQLEIRKAALLKYLASGGTLEQVRAVLEETGVRVACLNALEAVTFQDKRGRQELRELAEMLFYCCRYLNIPYIELVAAFDAPTDDVAEIHGETVNSLRELSDLARPYGVKLALEYMGVAPSSIKTFRQALDIINEVDRDNVGLLVDTWHHTVGGSAPEDLLRARADQIFVVHTSDCPRCEPGTLPRAQSFFPGEGEADIAGMVECLKRIGYGGVFSMEVMDPALQALPTEEFLERAKATTLPLLK